MVMDAGGIPQQKANAVFPKPPCQGLGVCAGGPLSTTVGLGWASVPALPRWAWGTVPLGGLLSAWSMWGEKECFSGQARSRAGPLLVSQPLSPSLSIASPKALPLGPQAPHFSCCGALPSISAIARYYLGDPRGQTRTFLLIHFFQ